MTSAIETDNAASERAMLVRFCARYSGDPDVAEDLAQQTLLAAWQHEQELRDPAARRSWLFGIARTTCLMWGRQQGRDATRRVAPTGDEDETLWIADDIDLEVDLERRELAELLDRALALLPADTRDVLVRRYVEELPQAEVAGLLRVTEGAIEARLQRGKLALRRILTTEMSAEAIAYGLIQPADAGWVETRFWCPGCGTRHPRGQLQPEQGRLILRCPGCPTAYDSYIDANFGGNLARSTTFKPAIGRVLDGIHQTYHVTAVDGVVACPACGKRVRSRLDDLGQVHVQCTACGVYNRETWHSLTWSLPEVRRFWREHPRMRFAVVREDDLDGTPIVVTRFESVTGVASIETAMRRDSFDILAIDERR
jgi:RNA polymerase sigma factor (sigma-70 family)